MKTATKRRKPINPVIMRRIGASDEWQTIGGEEARRIVRSEAAKRGWETRRQQNQTARRVYPMEAIVTADGELDLTLFDVDSGETLRLALGGMSASAIEDEVLAPVYDWHERVERIEQKELKRVERQERKRCLKLANA